MSNVTFAALYRELNEDHSGVTIDEFRSYFSPNGDSASFSKKKQTKKKKKKKKKKNKVAEHREQVRLDKLVDTRDYVDPESISRLKAETPALRDNLALLKKSLREHVS